MSDSAPAVSLSHRGGHRIFWLDAARALAVVAVTFNHTLHRSVMLEDAVLAQPGAYSFITGLLYVFSRLGAPLFLMISGALLLGRDYRTPGARSRFYRHNWLRLFVVTLIWLGIYGLLFRFLHGMIGEQPPWRLALSFLRDLLMFIVNKAGCLWYLVMILCIYPLIPLLSAAIKQLPGKAFLPSLALVLLFSFLLPNFNTTLKAAGIGLRLDSGVDPGYLLPVYVLYLVVGWYLAEGVLARRSARFIAIVFLLSLLGTALFQYWNFTAETYYEVRYQDVGVLIAAAALFELLRRLPESAGRIVGPAVRSLAWYSLGIYLAHDILLSVFICFLLPRLPWLTGFRLFLVLEALALFGAWFLVWLTGKIPFVGKWFYLLHPPPKRCAASPDRKEQIDPGDPGDPQNRA